MIENEKIDCIDALIFGLNRTTQWRKMAVRYPADPLMRTFRSLVESVMVQSRKARGRVRSQHPWISDGCRSVGFSSGSERALRSIPRLISLEFCLKLVS
jgi:hypothetical protein